MKKILLILMTLVSVTSADEPQSFLDAIAATRDARETLMKDLQEADQGNYRSEFTGCPNGAQFTKILEDEKRYNKAARVWLRLMSPGY
jgi:hypothetical protein